MKKPTQATVTISRGYARGAKDEARLRAAGVKTIYRSDKGEAPGKFKMRKGEYLGVVDGLRAFGEAKGTIIAAVELVHSWGATIIDAETKLCSRRDGAKMMGQALGPNRPSAEFKSMQAASVRERVKGRMPKREALIIWRNPKLSVSEAIELMTKWKQATAYNVLGKRDVPAGRRPK
jgi:hypothetical protein